MHQLVYVSAASWALSNIELNEILDASRRNNAAAGITGLLLHVDRGFLQILEGPRPALRETFARIGRDRRHTALRVLVEQESDGRLFTGWTMGFEKLSSANPRTADVFAVTSDAVQNAVPPERAAHIAVLLRNFYRVNAGQFAA